MPVMAEQTIESLQDTDTVEDLLEMRRIATTIMHCCSHKAAKKHCSDIKKVKPDTILVVRMQYQRHFWAADCQQSPAHNQLCICCHKVWNFAKVSQPWANAIHTNHWIGIQLTHQFTEAIPKQATTVMGSPVLSVNISTARTDILTCLDCNLLLCLQWYLN